MRAAQWIWARLVRPTLVIILMCIGVYKITRCNKDEGVGALDAEPLLLNNSLSESGADFAEVKRLKTLMAKLALAGYCLTPLSEGGFRVFRWNLSKDLPDRSAVEQFCMRVTS